MKLVFLGPSAPGIAQSGRFPDIGFRPPAGQGAVVAAVLDGANVIGLVDGTFEQDAAVWHKELLFALSRGVQVFGAASMGALRAAECCAFGMMGVGSIFRRYAEGDLIDDDAVAVVHAPAEMDSLPLSDPLVNLEATFAALKAQDLISGGEHEALVLAARGLFFKERSLSAVLRLTLPVGSRRDAVRKLVSAHRQDVKRDDALELLAAVSAAPDARCPPPTGWQFTETLAWKEVLRAIQR